MPLKDLPPQARPREKLLSRGASALSDAELLALLLRTGIEGKNVVAMAQEAYCMRAAQPCKASRVWGLPSKRN
jgi:DNA repair protein RadC